MNGYLSVKERAESEYVISRSRFIATVAPVADRDDADRFVKEISSKYPDATHNCYAYVADELGNVLRFSDDGEPQGTAGQPMLEVLRKQGLRKVAVVVTRYFGGIKLGAGGLVGAYTKSVTDALAVAETVSYVPGITLRVELDYPCLKSVQREIASFEKVKQFAPEFSNNVTLRFSVPTDFSEQAKHKITEITSGTAKIFDEEEGYICL